MRVAGAEHLPFSILRPPPTTPRAACLPVPAGGISCPAHTYTREPSSVAEICSDCRRRTLRADRHLHYNEDTGMSEWVVTAELESGRVPAGSVIVETEYHYGPCVT